MDKQYKKLVENALAHLGKFGVDGVQVDFPTTVEDDGVEVIVTVGTGRHAIKYEVLVKKGIRPATLGAVMHQIERVKSRTLLISDYVTPQIAQALKERQVSFLDTAGNAFLDQLPFYIWVKGEKNTQLSASNDGTGRAFQTGGLKVIFALLSNPDRIRMTYRDLALRAGVSRGTVGSVMSELADLGFAVKINGRRRLLQPEKLLKQWAEGYARTLRPKIDLGRYRADDQGWWTKLRPAKYDMVLGGEAAAERLIGVLRSQSCTLYGKTPNSKLLLDYGLRKDNDGEVQILEKFWDFKSVEVDLAPLPLIYADLLVHGDARCLEAADAIYDRIVDEFI